MDFNTKIIQMQKEGVDLESPVPLTDKTSEDIQVAVVVTVLYHPRGVYNDSCIHLFSYF